MVEISSLSALFCTCKGEIILLKTNKKRGQRQPHTEKSSILLTTSCYKYYGDQGCIYPPAMQISFLTLISQLFTFISIYLSSFLTSNPDYCSIFTSLLKPFLPSYLPVFLLFSFFFLIFPPFFLSSFIYYYLNRSIADCFKEAHESYADIPEVATQIRKGAALCRQQLMESTKMLRKVTNI